jgi:hypothetical protein
VIEPKKLRRKAIAIALLAGTLAGCGAAAKVADLTIKGPSQELRKRPEGAPRRSEHGGAPLLLLMFDGIDRATLYELLKENAMPGLASLLGGGANGTFPHARLDERLLSTLPSSTMAAWTTALTGRTPAEHGVSGNEFFMRESLRLGAPAPVTFDDAKPTLAIYTDAYLDSLKTGPSVYDRMRERDPNVLVWVAMHSIYSGADRLLVTKRTVLADAFEHLVAKVVSDNEKDNLRRPYETLDRQAIDVVVDELAEGALPDVLSIYLSGTDLYAHVAEEGPDEARRKYLTEVVDPALAKLAARLRARHALDDRFVIVTSDHGHTQVVKDKQHALSADRPDGPPVLMQRAGYRVRPFAIDVDKDKVFDSVWVAGGAAAYVYVADRSTCTGEKTRCDWSKPPRYEEDVLPLADAFFRADATGELVPQLKGTLDLVLTRRPRPHEEVDLPFEVYIGGGRTIALDTFLSTHPHPTYVELAPRLRDLGVGVRGERAGDVLLFAHNGDRERPDERFYFAAPYRSWHGSPSRRDSEVPLIVAHARLDAATIARRLDRHLAERPFQQKVTDVLLDLRYGPRE